MADQKVTSWYLTIVFKILTITTTLLVIIDGFYLCFWGLSVVKLPFVYRKFLSLGIVMVSFGFVVLVYSLLPQNLYEYEHKNVFGCGSSMTFAASFVPLILALITFLLPIESDIAHDLDSKRRFIKLNQTHSSRINFKDNNSTGLCNQDIKCKSSIMETCALHQMITIGLSLINGLSLNFAAFIKEYNTYNQVYTSPVS